MNTALPAFGGKKAFFVLIAGFALVTAGLLVPAVALAALTTDSATLNGAANVTVGLGDTINASVTGTLTGGTDWKGTEWRIATTPPGATSCANTGNHNSDASFTEAFSITAPTTVGTYNVYFRINAKDDCTGTQGSLLTLSNAVTVVAPDLTATKTNNLNGGNALVGGTFTWQIRVQNSGTATASFANNGKILKDEMPDTGVSPHSAPVLVTSGTTGTISCTQGGTNNRDLTCKAVGAVTMPVDSFFDVFVDIHPTAAGTLVNPRATKTCAADPDDNASESNESNNSCSDTVTVSASGTLTVNKVLVPSGDGGKFNLQIDGITKAADVGNGGTTGAVLVATGTRTVSETAGTGTTLSDYTPVISGDCATNGTITLTSGQNKTCTITNTKKPKLTVNKVTVPSNDNGLFNLQIDSVTVGTGANQGNNGTTGVVTTTVGAHTVGETAGTATSLSDYTTVIDGDCAANGSITLAAGDNKVCTITNTKKPKLTIIKVTDPTNDTGKFNLSINGTEYATDVSNTGMTGAQFATIGANTFAEAAGTGTNLNDYMSVVSGAGCGGTATAGTITLAAGDNKTCTITNTKKGTIIVEKQTLPDGVQDSFTFTGDASGTISDGGQITVNNLVPATYTSTENDPTPTYDLTSISCDDGQSATPSTFNVGTRTATFKLDAGETVKCIFTDTKRGHIVVDKITDPSGDLTFFSFDANGGSYSDFSLADADPPNDQALVPGSYSVQETVPGGWTLTNLVCIDPDGGSSVDVPNATATLDLDPGETIYCNFYDTKKGTVIVKKVMVGGTDTFNFTGTPSGAISIDGGTISSQVVPGQYVSTETLVSGWDLTGVTCDDGDSVGSVPNANATFNVEAGETVTCTFTNTKKPKLTIIKVTDPTNDTGKFNLSINGTQYATDVSNTGTTGAQFGVVGVNTFAEAAGTGTSLSDYTSIVSGAGCGGTATAGTITLAAGDNKTCTITNTKKGTVIVKKVMVGGTDTFNFTGTPSGAISIDGGTISSQVVPGQYVSTETLVSGWDLTGVTCDDGDSVGSVPNANATFNVAAGETVTCTFTNTKKGHIKVDKVTNPSGDSQSFSFTAGGAGYANFALTDAAAPNDQEVVPGAYTVSETVPGGWDLTSATCDLDETPASLDVGPGETVTCTFTNTKRGDLKVIKNTTGGDDTFSFTHSIAGLDASLTTVAGTDEDTSDKLVPGTTYAVTEDGEIGWDLTSASCALDGGAPTGSVIGGAITGITVEAGKTTTCTFTNTKRGHIIVDKVTVGGDDTFLFDASGGSYADFSLTGAATPDDQELVPGAYSVSETVPAGWDSDGGVCDLDATPDSIDVGAGETVTCTFTNTKHGSVTILKFEDLDGDGVKDQGEQAPAQPVTVAVGRVTGPPQGPNNHIPIEIIAMDLTGGGVVTLHDIPTGPVKVFEKKQTGWVPTTPPSGGSIDSFFDITYRIGLVPIPLADSFFDVNVEPGQTADHGTLPGCQPIPVVGVCQPVPLEFGNFELITVRVQKDVVDPQGNDVNDPHPFDVVLDGDVQNPQPIDDAINQGLEALYGGVGQGPHTLTETPDAAYDTTSYSNDNDADPTNGTTFSPQSGVPIIIVVTNKQKPGKIIIEKTTVGGFGTFTFSGDHGLRSKEAITDAGHNPSVDSFFDIFVDLGSEFTITEQPLDDWTPDKTECKVTVNPGETKTCYFTNTKKGKIVIIKDTVPDNATDFAFTSNTLAPFSLDDDADGTLSNTQTFNNLPPGPYDVAETPNGDYITLVACVSSLGHQETAGNISLDPGETVTCTFTNTFQKKQSSTTTQVHKDPHVDITNGTVPVGTLVHDQATVAGDGVTAPTGNVTFTLHGNPNCDAGLIDTAIIALSLSGTNGVAESIVRSNLVAGSYGYKASYGGDLIYLPSEGVCEPFTLQAPAEGAGKISGIKFDDTNGNGKKEKNEPLLSGWTIYLDTNNNGALDDGEPSTETNAQGEYEFTGLADGTYHVREVAQDGWLQTKPANPDEYVVVLGGGKKKDNGKDKDFGNFKLKLGEIRGLKYEDKNGNGKRDDGEPALSGWTIILTKPDGSTMNAVTGEDGTYAFTDLGPGKYKLGEEKRKNWKQTSKAIKPIEMKSGLVSEGNDFGNQQQKKK